MHIWTKYTNMIFLPALIHGEEMLKRGNLSIPENKGRSTLLTEKVRFSLVILFVCKITDHMIVAHAYTGH